MTKPRRAWTAHELTLLKRDYPHVPTALLAEQLGRTVGQVYQAADRHGLRKSPEYLASPHACRLRRGEAIGWEHRFAKGAVPWNKGKPGSTGHHPNTVANQFAPGRDNGRSQPIDAMRVNDDGYLDRKVRADGPPHRRWVAVHRLVWESEHGPIPDGQTVVLSIDADGWREWVHPEDRQKEMRL